MNLAKTFNSLRWKIVLAFGLITLIFVINNLVGLYGVSRVIGGFRKQQQSQKAAQKLLEIDRKVQQLRMRVSEFSYTGHETHRLEMIRLADELQLEIQTVEPELRSSETRTSLTLMRERLLAFQQQFDFVIEERELRTTLVQKRLPEKSAQVRDAIRAFESKLDPELLEEHRFAILSVRESFSRGENEALRYIASPDFGYAKRAKTAFGDAIQLLRAIEITEDEELANLLENAVTSLDDYEAVFLRAVQATRGYLYLVNVVMAGEASEFAYYSNLVKEAAEDEAAETNSQTEAQMVTARNVLLGALAIALLLAVVASRQLMKAILSPLRAVTKTFRQLAQGEMVQEIPGEDRDDEIGELASAAGVFNERNQQTEKLLAESRRLGEELAAQAKSLETSNAALDSFAYVASHDLKAPLRGIQQLSNWIEEDAGDKLPEESRTHLEKLQMRVTKMQSLLEELLQYSRVGRIEEETEAVDVSEMLRELVDILDNPQEIAIELPESLPTVQTAKAPFESVFLNLLTNAIKHHDRPDKGQIQITCEEQGDIVEFVVKDNGPGIEAKNHARVFDMFQRVGNTAVDGTGMGLAIIKKQIRSRGCDITLESEPGKGAAFRFQWPLVANTDIGGKVTTGS